MGGLNEQVVLKRSLVNATTLPQGTAIASLEDASNVTQWHYGVGTFGMVCAVIINLIVLNMYIGVLGLLYKEAYQRRFEHVALFRGTFAWRTLLLWSGREHRGECGEYIPDRTGVSCFL